MTLTQMLADLYRRTDQTTAPTASTTTRYTAYLNEALQEVLSEPGMGLWLARNEPMVTFASVLNQAVYAIPWGSDRVDAITERTTQIRLRAQSVDWYRRAAPDPTVVTGTPGYYVPFGFQAVSVQPAAATGLWAVSTAAGDTTQSVKIETMRTGGNPFSSALTLNGTTRVQLGTATDHVEVTKFYVSAVVVGDINLYTASTAGTLLATIPIGQTFARYYSFALWPTPAAAITYYVEGERPLPDMSNGTDEPPFPTRFHRVLVDGALWREYEKTDDTRAPTARARYVHGVSQIRYFISCPPDFLPVAGSRNAELSRLGGWFKDGAGVH